MAVHCAGSDISVMCCGKASSWWFNKPGYNIIKSLFSATPLYLFAAARIYSAHREISWRAGLWWATSAKSRIPLQPAPQKGTRHRKQTSSCAFLSLSYFCCTPWLFFFLKRRSWKCRRADIKVSYYSPCVSPKLCLCGLRHQKNYDPNTVVCNSSPCTQWHPSIL